jgi:hypothetical protein
MRRSLRGLRGVVIAVAAVAAGAPGVARADMTMVMAGTDLKGDRMRVSCKLLPASPPSNTFTGRCEVTVGAERLAIAGLDVNGESVLSAVLDGRITIRGRAESASGRFLQMVVDGADGFPVYLHIDPFGRAWALQRDVPGGGREALTGGRISEGSLGLVIQ